MGIWLKDLRKAKRMTQKELGIASGISRTMITEIECGNASPSIKTAQSIAAVLDFPWTRFFEPKQNVS